MYPESGCAARTKTGQASHTNVPKTCCARLCSTAGIPRLAPWEAPAVRLICAARAAPPRGADRGGAGRGRGRGRRGQLIACCRAAHDPRCGTDVGSASAGPAARGGSYPAVSGSTHLSQPWDVDRWRRGKGRWPLADGSRTWGNVLVLTCKSGWWICAFRTSVGGALPHMRASLYRDRLLLQIRRGARTARDEQKYQHEAANRCLLHSRESLSCRPAASRGGLSI